MGTHRSSESGSRGVSAGIIAAIVAVVVLIAAVVGYLQLRESGDSRDTAAAAECVEGTATLDVTVDPVLADPVRAVADRYNATAPRVRDHCAEVHVTARASADVAAAFAAGTWTSPLGAQPALWIPDSTRSVEAVRVPGLIEGNPISVATSAIVLAVSEPLRAALDQAKAAWSDLPRLQQGSLSEIGLSGWGGLRMALPAGDTATAAAVAVGSSLSGVDPLTVEAAKTGQVVSAISVLAADAPQSADPLTALVQAASENPDAPVHAVAATEQQVQAQAGAAVYRPIGAAPLADYPAALMTGAWVDETENLIAGLFTDYLRAPAQSVLLAQAGFTAPMAAPAPDKATLDAVRQTLENPVLGVSTTVLLDVSSSMGTKEGAMTRLANALAALRSSLTTLPPDFGLGVWTFGKNLDGSKPYKVQTPTAALTDAQRSSLDTALGAVKPSETKTDQAYPTLLAAYEEVAGKPAAGRTNSILLITDGPDDDSAITGAQLLARIAEAGGAAPVRIDVVVIGTGDGDTLRTLAANTGGTYATVPSTNDLKFGTAVVQALTNP
ncbi:VWA domain-containing protein [Nocardia sp. NPDC057227]|uniref:VWA domain-containing protein n=1 Tax=Nocardia sp. NPDC057227 TaxID=3346056 RepID=UPI003636ABF9